MDDQKLTFGLTIKGVTEMVDVLVTQSEERADTWLHRALHEQDAGMLYIGIDCHFTSNNVPATVELSIGRYCLIFQLRGSKLPGSILDFLESSSAKKFLTTKRLKGKLMSVLKDDLGVQTFDCTQARGFLERKEGRMRLPNWRDEAAITLQMESIPSPKSVENEDWGSAYLTEAQMRFAATRCIVAVKLGFHFL